MTGSRSQRRERGHGIWDTEDPGGLPVGGDIRLGLIVSQAPQEERGQCGQSPRSGRVKAQAEVETTMGLGHLVWAGVLRQMWWPKRAGPPDPPLAGQYGPFPFLCDWFQNGMCSKMAQ